MSLNCDPRVGSGCRMGDMATAPDHPFEGAGFFVAQNTVPEPELRKKMTAIETENAERLFIVNPFCGFCPSANPAARSRAPGTQTSGTVNPESRERDWPAVEL